MSVQYSKEEYGIAKNVSCFDYVVANGYEVEKHGHHHKLKKHDSLVLFNDGGFKWYSKDGISGNAITLLKELEGKSLNVAIKELAEFGGGVRSPTLQNNSKNNANYSKKQNINEFILPQKNNSTKRVFEYLTKKRGLHKDIVDYAITNNLVYQDNNGNCIFVGYDEMKEPKFATVRGTYEKLYRKDIAASSKSCGFSVVNKNSNVLYVFESAIDSLSMMSINNSLKENYLSLNGTSLGSLENFLKNNSNIDTIITCLDNDEAGRNATKKIWGNYKESYNMKYYSLFAKDVNEQLLLDKLEPKIIILDSNIVEIGIGDIYSFKEFDNIMNNNQGSSSFIKVKVLQGDKELSSDMLLIFEKGTRTFERAINHYLSTNLSTINSLKKEINSMENVDKKELMKDNVELNGRKSKLLQLSKVYTKYKENESYINNAKSKNLINRKVGDVKNGVKKSDEIPKANQMER